MVWALRILTTTVPVSGFLAAAPAFSAEPKQGEILRLYHRDSPASPAIIEESLLSA